MLCKHSCEALISLFIIFFQSFRKQCKVLHVTVTAVSLKMARQLVFLLRHYLHLLKAVNNTSKLMKSVWMIGALLISCHVPSVCEYCSRTPWRVPGLGLAHNCFHPHASVSLSVDCIVYSLLLSPDLVNMYIYFFLILRKGSTFNCHHVHSFIFVAKWLKWLSFSLFWTVSPVLSFSGLRKRKKSPPNNKNKK